MNWEGRFTLAEGAVKRLFFRRPQPLPRGTVLEQGIARTLNDRACHRKIHSG